MADRYIEQAPENVIWKNMSLNPYEATIRKAISYAITVGMIVLWTFPGQFRIVATISDDSGIHRCFVKHQYLNRNLQMAILAQLPYE
jgi:hypothetical protein